MILSKKYDVQLKKQYQKILYLCPAFNNTFCFLAMCAYNQDCLVHVDEKGCILFEHVFQKSIDSFAMISKTEYVVLQTRTNCITILKIPEHQLIRIPYNFINEESDQSQLHIFSKTKILCVQENGRYNDHRFKLTFFNYPLSELSKSIHQLDTQESQWTYQYITKKGNDHSMICWFKPRQENYISFKTYSLNINIQSQSQTQGSYHTYNILNQICLLYDMTQMQCIISTMWQMQKDIFILVCVTNISKNDHFDVINNNFICNIKNSEIRQTHFIFNENQDYLVDCYNLGSNCMFRTFKFKNGSIQLSPIFYVNKKSEKIIAVELWQCSYLYKYEFSGFDSSTFFQGLYENNDVNNFTLSVKTLLSYKQVSLHLLLSVQTELDDDLVWDVFEILNDDYII